MMLKNRNVRLALVAVVGLAYFAFSYVQNGFTRDLTAHFAANGIVLSLVGSDGGIGSRRGHVSFRADAAVEATIVERFGLKPVEPSAVPQIMAVLPMGTRALWGITGRPATLKLKSGAQFEYLYLQKTPDGLTFVVAEYAAG
jgi:hypothetical protein